MEGNLIKEVKEGEPKKIIFRNNIGACFLYRRMLSKKVGEYDEKTFLAEDYDFFIRCYMEAKGKFFHISEDLYNYGRHDANLTVTRQKDIAHKTFDVMMNHFGFLYSQCDTDEDRFMFFDELLELLHDSEEKEAHRRKFYALNESYQVYDTKRIRNRPIKAVLSLPKRIVKIILRKISNK